MPYAKQKKISYKDESQIETGEAEEADGGQQEEEVRTPQTTSPQRPSSPEANPVNLEQAFSDIFSSSKSGTGEEELLRIASQFSLQITAPQMRCLMYLIYRAERSKNETEKRLLQIFVTKWLEYKQNNNSDVFVMKALEHISLRHFINENSFKVNIDKG